MNTVVLDNPNTKSKPTAAEHFVSSNHTANDMQLKGLCHAILGNFA